MAEENVRQNWLGVIIRFVVSALVLMIVSWAAPGFVVSGGFVGALIAAAVIAILGYLAEVLLGDKITPQSRGLVGFIVAAVVIYLAQFIIPGLLNVSIIGALIAAFVIGLIDAFVPTLLR
ncbi:MAG: phage holin family protein [Peptococcaceae bacterium]|nr:phage holin family protein [Peptococcaceae bacterium]